MNVDKTNGIDAGELKAPAPTAWPIVLAFGFALMFAGLLTSVSISLLGAILAFCGSVGWLREILPHEHEIPVIAEPEDNVVTTSRRTVERFPLAEAQVRAWLPLETYPVSAGLKGGIVGSAAMAIVACVFGELHARSIWYPINLLAAVLYSQSQSLSAEQLNAFHVNSFLSCDGPSFGWLLSGWAVVRRDAPHASSASDSSWGSDCSIAVVGSFVGRDGSGESFAEQSYRLGLVCCLAGGIRRDCGSRSAAPIEGTDPRECALCNSRGNRSAGNYGFA